MIASRGTATSDNPKPTDPCTAAPAAAARLAATNSIAVNADSE